MTEALRIAPGTQDGTTPWSSALPNFELPFHLRRSTLKQIRREEGALPEHIWSLRGEAVEIRLQSILASQTEIIKSVIKNPPNTEGSDLAVNMVDGGKRFVEVKSSTQGLGDYKDDIIKDIEEKNGGQLIGPWARQLSREQWLVDRNTILINGGEKDRRERTAGEILYESFYPQLERINTETQGLREKFGGLLRDHLHSKRLHSLEAKSIQLFP